MRAIILALAILVLMVVIDHPARVVAYQEAGQPILRSEANFTYGQAMVFRLMVVEMGQIETVTLFFRPERSNDSYAVDVPVTPGVNVQAEYTLDLTQIRIPPFSTVVYWWELTVAGGRKLQVPEQRLHYADDQFAWQEEEKGGITVYWSGAEPSLGTVAHDAIDRTLLRLGSVLPLQQVAPFDVYVYPSTADLAAALRLAGREWREGATFPELNVLLVTAVNANTAEADLGRTIPRELTHLLLYQYAGARYEQIPIWLREGIATYVAGEPAPSQQSALEASLATDTIMDINELCRLQASDVTFATTAQSESLVRYLAGAYGESVLRRLVGEMAAGGECTGVLEAVLGIPASALETNWLASLHPTTAATTFFSENVLWLAIIAAGFAGMALMIWRPDGRKVAGKR